jgi:hypothetical protein
MAIATAERARRVGQDIRPEEALPYHYPWFRQMKDCSQSVYPEVIAALHEWGIDPDLHRITIQETGYLDLLREHSAHRAEDSDAIESPSSGTSQADHPQPDHFPSQNAGALGQIAVICPKALSQPATLEMKMPRTLPRVVLYAYAWVISFTAKRQAPPDYGTTRRPFATLSLTSTVACRTSLYTHPGDQRIFLIMPKSSPSLSTS